MAALGRGHLRFEPACLLPTLAAGRLGDLVALLGRELGELGPAEVIQGRGVLVDRVGRRDPGVEPGALLDPGLDLRGGLLGEPALAVIRGHLGGLLPLDHPDEHAPVGVAADDVFSSLAAGHQLVEGRHVELADAQPPTVAGVAAHAVGHQDRGDVPLERERPIGRRRGGVLGRGILLEAGAVVVLGHRVVALLGGGLLLLKLLRRQDHAALSVIRRDHPGADQACRQAEGDAPATEPTDQIRHRPIP